MAGLTAIGAANAKPGRHSDGGGLFLLVRPTGSRSWLLRVQYDGQRRDYGLGGFAEKQGRPGLTLAEARERAALWRKWAKDGLDPRREWAKQNEKVPTFEEAARACFEEVSKGFRNPKHKAQWIGTLKTYAFPQIGSRSVDSVGAPEIISVLRSIWHEKPETASRLKQRIGRVLDFSFAHSWRDDGAPMAAVAMGLGKHKNEPEHFAAIPYSDLPGMMAKLDQANRKLETVGRSALAFQILTAARPGEVRGMIWSEVDLDAGQWAIPAKRYKTGKRHVVPLSSAALDLLRDRRGMFEPDASSLVFQGAKAGRPISNATMNRALSRLGYGDYTVHGTGRSGFRDWAGEAARARREVCEAALGHVVANEAERAYARATYLDERRGLMQQWADYLQTGNGNYE